MCYLRGGGGIMVDMEPAHRNKRPAYVAYAAHALHDGFTDLMYVLLPLFQAEFGLAYAQTAFCRSILAGAWRASQCPRGLFSSRFVTLPTLVPGRPSDTRA